MEQENQVTYEVFERDWKQRHKGSIPRKRRVSSAREFFWIGFWLMVAFGAAVFSAAHTIPAAEMTIFQTVPYRSVLAVTAFVIVELVIFGAAAGRREIGWLKYLLMAAVLVALVGNVGSTVRAVAENHGDWLNQIGGIVLAIIAPITALASGEVLHIQLDKRNEKIQKAQTEFDTDWKDMDSKINRDYAKTQKTSRNFMKSGEEEKPHETSRKPVKPRVKIHEIARLIHENGDHNLSTAEMMDKYEISLGSTSKVRDILKQSGNGYMNGGGIH